LDHITVVSCILCIVCAVVSVSCSYVFDGLFSFFFSSRRRHTISVSAFLLNRSSDLLIFAAEGLTKRSAVGFLLRSLIMFQTFISRHNSNFFSDKLVLTSVTPASSAPVLQTPKATSSTLYFDS